MLLLKYEELINLFSEVVEEKNACDKEYIKLNNLSELLERNNETLSTMNKNLKRVISTLYKKNVKYEQIISGFIEDIEEVDNSVDFIDNKYACDIGQEITKEENWIFIV